MDQVDYQGPGTGSNHYKWSRLCN